MEPLGQRSNVPLQRGYGTLPLPEAHNAVEVNLEVQQSSPSRSTLQFQVSDMEKTLLVVGKKVVMLCDMVIGLQRENVRLSDRLTEYNSYVYGARSCLFVKLKRVQDLEADMARNIVDLNKHIESLNDRMEALRSSHFARLERVNELETDMARKIEDLNEQFESLNDRMEALENRMSTLEQRPPQGYNPPSAESPASDDLRMLRHHLRHHHPHASSSHSSLMSIREDLKTMKQHIVRTIDNSQLPY